MQIISVAGTGKNFEYQWPQSIEEFDHWIDYVVREGKDEFIARIAFGIRSTYGKARARVIVWIEGKPEVEFFGVDDFSTTGDMITELKLEANRICRYPEEPIPLEYGSLQVVGIPTRVSGSGVRGAWGVITNVADHKTMLYMAFLRKRQRGR